MEFSAFPVSSDLINSILAHSVDVAGIKFKKGRCLTSDDIQKLDDAGVNEIMVAKLSQFDMHEDEAARQIAEIITGDNLDMSAAFTGRVNIYARSHGVNYLNVDLLKNLNRLDEAITVATLANYEVVLPKQMVATVKIIPFAVSTSVMNEVTNLVSSPLLGLKPLKRKKICLIQTRHTATKESVLDKTGDVLSHRLAELDNELISDNRCNHDIHELAELISMLNVEVKPDIFILAGASAISDNADVLPAAVKQAGGSVIRFGMPVDPGNLLMLAKIDKAMVIGMPGCARSPKLNGFDWILQRMMADIEISPNDVSDMAIGGLLKEIATRPLPRNRTVDTPSTKHEKQRKPIVSAIILAAGQSRRMGDINKLLVPIHEKPMLHHTCEIVLASDAEDACVVTGHEKDRVLQALTDVSVKSVHNSLFADGISSSLKAGVSAIREDADAVLVCLGDMPLIKADEINKIIAAFNSAEGRSICVPTHKGKRGNPVLIGKQYFSEIQQLSGDIGAKYLISEYPDQVCEVEMATDGVLSDFDNPESLKRLS